MVDDKSCWYYNSSINTQTLESNIMFDTAPITSKQIEIMTKYAPKRSVKKSKPVESTSYVADDVWAASCAAFRINGSYVKIAVDSDVPDQKTNRRIVDELLSDPTKITAEDREQGEIVRRYYKAMTFKLIEGTTLSQFAREAMYIADKDTITSNYDLAVIVSLPASHVKSLKRDTIENRIKWARGGYVGVVGGKIELNIEVLKALWSQNWNTWYVTGITPDDQVVFFSFKKQKQVGDTMRITGKVKSQRETSTQLSHVKENNEELYFWNYFWYRSRYCRLLGDCPYA